MRRVLGALAAHHGASVDPTTPAQPAPATKGPCWAGVMDGDQGDRQGRRQEEHRFFAEGGAGVKAAFTREGKYVGARYDFRESEP